MDKQKLPIRVIKDLNFIKKYVDEELFESGLGFTIKYYKRFGFLVSHTDYKSSKFILDDYEIDEEKEEVKYYIRFTPYSEFTEIADTRDEYVDLDGFKKYFQTWVSNVENFLELEFFDMLLKQEEDESPVQSEENIYEEKDKIFPYCLKSLKAQNFQGIKHATIENLPVDTQWVFLVGENGFGKSTVLQSILLGLHGSKDGNYELIQDREIRIQVEYKSEDGNFINDCWRNTHPLTHIAAYGPSRLNLQADATLSDEARKSSVTYGLFNSDGALLNIEAKLKDWLLQKDKKRFELVKKAFLKLIPHLADMRLNESTSQIEYLEKDIVEGTETYEPLPYQKLASGFRAIIGLAGDMIVRLSNAQPTIKDPAQLKGIVIIDELDLHWHPKLQKQIPQLFSSVFPKVQFIVSTHSPIPLLGAPHNSVVLKVTRTKEEGVKIERVNVDLKYLTPNLILTSGIFDMDDVLSVENDDLTKTRTEDTFEEMKHNDEVEDYLAEFEKSNRQFPDELFEPKAN